MTNKEILNQITNDFSSCGVTEGRLNPEEAQLPGEPYYTTQASPFPGDAWADSSPAQSYGDLDDSEFPLCLG